MNNLEKSIKQFDDWAFTYDAGLWKKYFTKSIDFCLTKLPKLQVNASLVDLGTGTGDLCFKVLKYKIAKTVVGVDPSKEMLKIAKKKAELIIDPPKFIEGDAESMPISNGSVDAVVCLNSFHHYQDHKKAVKEINRVLNIGGYFLLLDPIRDGIIRGLWVKILKHIFHEPYARFFKRTELDFLITGDGFILVSQQNFLYFTRCSIYKKNV